MIRIVNDARKEGVASKIIFSALIAPVAKLMFLRMRRCKKLSSYRLPRFCQGIQIPFLPKLQILKSWSLPSKLMMNLCFLNRVLKGLNGESESE